MIIEFHYKRYMEFKQQGLIWLAELPDNFECCFSEMNVERLKIKLGEICEALGKDGRRFQKFQIAFSDVEGLLHLLQNNTQPLAMVETLEKSFQAILENYSKDIYEFFPSCDTGH